MKLQHSKKAYTIVEKDGTGVSVLNTLERKSNQFIGINSLQAIK